MKMMVWLGALALVAAGPAFAQSNGNGNQAVHHWNTKAFATHPPANTNGLAYTPNANTRAFRQTPRESNRAFGNANGPVTAFGNGTNAFGNQVTGSNNARRLANSFGTGTDHHASPMGPSGSRHYDAGK